MEARTFRISFVSSKNSKILFNINVYDDWDGKWHGVMWASDGGIDFRDYTKRSPLPPAVDKAIHYLVKNKAIEPCNGLRVSILVSKDEYEKPIVTASEMKSDAQVNTTNNADDAALEILG